MRKNGLTGRSRTVTDGAVTIKKAVFGINRTDFARVTTQKGAFLKS